MGEEELGNLAVTDVGGGAEGVLPVAEAPVDGGSDKRRAGADEGLHLLKVGMGGADHLAGEFEGLHRVESGHGIGSRGDGSQGQSEGPQMTTGE